MDRDELKAAAKEFYASWMADETNEGSTWGTASVLADFALEQIEALRDKTRWIPVSEKLPKKRELVWVTNQLGTVFTDFYDPSVTKAWRSREVVLAWMPLPEPYKP